MMIFIACLTVVDSKRRGRAKCKLDKISQCNDVIKKGGKNKGMGLCEIKGGTCEIRRRKPGKPLKCRCAKQRKGHQIQ
ncbi:hypothetical protein DPMN_025061 [Dreissena polymorpha]|uniref:Uncharacterized protein n=1 Tax=Dreissena polymorpha TaxID=45954 RepID=A0A9D4LQW7_DREPO|nr:hypothetical protein DPMN_025061 [Dreissena polymorpha]